MIINLKKSLNIVQSCKNMYIYYGIYCMLHPVYCVKLIHWIHHVAQACE